MRNLKYNTIKKITGDLISIDTTQTQNHLLNIKFGFIEGIVPFEIVIDKGKRIIYTKQNYTGNQKVNIKITKLRKHLYKGFVVKDKVLNSFVDRLLGLSDNMLQLGYYHTSNKERLNSIIKELEGKYLK